MTGGPPTTLPLQPCPRRGGLRLPRRLRFAWLLTALTLPGLAQSLQVGDAGEDYLRVLQVRGLATTSAFTVRPFASAATWAGVGLHPWQEAVHAPQVHAFGPIEFQAEDLQFRAFENTDYPWGQNDGAVWQGRGLTTEWSEGGYLQRQVHDNDAYYQLAAADPTLGFRGHDVDLAYGASVLGVWHHLELVGSLTWIKEFNRSYILKLVSGTSIWACLYDGGYNSRVETTKTFTLCSPTSVLPPVRTI